MSHSIHMKLLTVLSAVLLLIASVSVGASALAEGEPVRTYAITTESGSDVYTPDPASVTVKEGETYTFTLPDDLPTTLHDDELGDYKVEFSCWRFTGTFDVVEGAVNEDGECLDKTVTLKPKSDLKAVACFYEDNALFYMVRVNTNSDAYKPLIEQGECSKGENWMFSVPEDIKDFECWEFTGEYEVIEGSVDANGVSKDRTVVLKPASGIEAYARFTEKATDDEAGKATDDEPGQNKGNTDKTSPKTGDKLPVIICLMLFAAYTGVLAVRKLKE